MISILILGLLIGMQHALESDHIAAVSSIISGKRSLKQIIFHGAFWGVGHSISLILIAGSAIFIGYKIDGQISNFLEFIVGIMLLMLGAHVIYRLRRDRIHLHFHKHGTKQPHLHAHSHINDQISHKKSSHEHKHNKKIPVKILLVGIMHGMAGSAALLVITAANMGKHELSFLYIIIFALGSIIGMAMLSAIIAVPLKYSARILNFANQTIQTIIGIGTMIFGLMICYQTAILF